MILAGVALIERLRDVLETLPGTTYYTLAAIALLLGGIVASIVRARRTPESRRVEIPAWRRGFAGGHP